MFKRIKNLGISAELDAETRQLVTMVNTFSIVMVIFMLITVLTAIIDQKFWLVIISLAMLATSVAVPVLNAYRQYAAARNVFVLGYLLNLPTAALVPSPDNYMEVRLVTFAYMVLVASTFPQKSKMAYVHYACMIFTGVFLQDILDMLEAATGLSIIYGPNPPYQAYMIMSMVGVGIAIVLGLIRKQHFESLQQADETLTELQLKSQAMESQQAEILRNNERLAAATAQMKQAQNDMQLQKRELERANQAQLQLVQELQHKTEAIEVQRKHDQMMAEFADVARWKTELNMQEWGNEMLNFLCRRAGITSASLYVAEGQGADIHLRHTSGFGVPPSQNMTVLPGQGLVGQVMKDSQERYVHLNGNAQQFVATSLVTLLPKHYYLQPLSYQDEVYGVLEVLNTTQLSEEARGLLNGASAIIAANLQSVLATQRIEVLYKEAQDKTQVLLQQEEEMRQNYEELQATQEEMKRAERQLQQLNESLESRVQGRTAELELAMEELKTTQNQLVMREKMATLGTLVAGVAHEINTPIGAVRASADNLLDNLPTVVREFPILMQRMPTHLIAQLTGLLDKLLAPDNVATLTSREQRQLRKNLAAYLEEKGVPEADTYARALIDSGYKHDTLEETELFCSDWAEEANQLIYAICQIKVNVENISVASDKTKKIVYALKNYSRAENREEDVVVELQENVHTIITLYHNQMKHGVEVDFDVKATPKVLANPDSLGQIWTNIISNALQAMKFHGLLRVEIDQVGDLAVVKIIDNGPGIPPAIQEKIFEPFFTTKAAGEGTGLGLDICKKIVESFHGTMGVESRPGHTEFTVTLPVA